MIGSLLSVLLHNKFSGRYIKIVIIIIIIIGCKSLNITECKLILRFENIIVYDINYGSKYVLK